MAGNPLNNDEDAVERQNRPLVSTKQCSSITSSPNMPMSPTQEFLDSIKDDKVGHSPCSNECTCYHPPRTYPPWESDLHNQQLDGIHLENMKAIIARRRLAKSNVPEDHLCYKDDEDINEIRRRIANKSKETKDMEELQEGFKKQQLAFQALLMERKMSRNAGQKKS